MGPDNCCINQTQNSLGHLDKQRSDSCQLNPPITQVAAIGRRVQGGELWVKHLDQIVHRGAVFKASRCTSTVSRGHVDAQRESREKTAFYGLTVWPNSQLQETTTELQKKKSLCICHIVLKSWRGHRSWELLAVHVRVRLYACSSPINETLTWPARPSPPEDKKYKNIETRDLKFKKTKCHPILWWRSWCLHNEIQLVTKINTFFIVFHFDDDEHGLKIKKASKCWYIYGSVTFFFLSISFFVFFSPRPFCISVRVCTDGEGRFHPPVYPSACLSVHPFLPRVWTCCVECLLPVPVSCFLSVGGRGRSRKREQYAGQAGTVIWLCTHSWSVHGFQQTAALFPKV